MRVEAPIAPKEQLTPTDFQVLGLLANNYTKEDVARRLNVQKRYIVFIKRRIIDVFQESEMEEGLCKAISWSVLNYRVSVRYRHNPSRISLLDEKQLAIFVLMGRGWTRYQIAEELGLASEKVVIHRE